MVKIKTLVGGSSVNEDNSYLKSNKPYIIIGTVGRVFDMIRRKNIKTDKELLILMKQMKCCQKDLRHKYMSYCNGYLKRCKLDYLVQQFQ